MTGSYLLLAALGPVQDFIAQGRRTRDLWFGSHLLSELSRAAARSLAESGARLIFPALEKGNPELEPCDQPTRRTTGLPPVSIANKILAELGPDLGSAEHYAMQAREAARVRWRTIADGVYSGRGRTLLAGDICQVWREQVEDVLEFYAVWVPLDAGYQEARHAAEQELAGRKNLRDFAPWRHDRTGAPKSSLDGARVSVLHDDRSHAMFGRLRISRGEQLDAIGLIKRAGFEPDQFVPIVNIAAGPWLKRASVENKSLLREAGRACGEWGIPRINRSLPVVEPLPFDASVLYPNRWAMLFEEAEPRVEADIAREFGNEYISPLLRNMNSAPPSYVACMAADGDRMGQAIDGLRCPAENRRFSEQLAQFPGEAREIIEQRYLGSLIYAGGDDVLAFLPVAHAPPCAAALAAAFRRRMESTVSGGIVPTLSVGIGIGHVMEAMGGLLSLAREAERAAKEAGRNALAIIVDKRSGGQRQFTCKWAEDPITRMHEDRSLFDEVLSAGKIYELEVLLHRFPDSARVTDATLAAEALRGYAEDLLAHTEEERTASLANIGVPADVNYPDLRKAIASAIDRLLVVKTLCEWGFGRTDEAGAST
jgi:CRISPR-associated protein Cmr2